MRLRQIIGQTYIKYSTMSNITNATSASHIPKIVSKVTITSKQVCAPVGPYSHAVLANGTTLYVSGVLGLDISSNLISGIEGQTRQALDNLKLILEAGAASLKTVVKTTILLASMEDFQCVNKIYGEYFTENYPARATYQVGRLPLNASIEIEAIALSGQLEDGSKSCPCPSSDS